MSIHRRRSSSPAVAPPLEDENLLSEILLCLPPDPSSLPRASAVCKLWRHLVSDPRFIRRFRRQHHRNPPLLGFFKSHRCESFQPTMDAPNRVSPGRFSLQQEGSDDILLFLGCRHGLALMLDPRRRQALVWDPVTGDQDRIALPPRFHGVEPTTHGAVVRAAGDVYFQVVLVRPAPATDGGLPAPWFACVYSSETGLWGDLVSASLASADFLSCEPAVLIGDRLYWTLIGDSPGTLEFDSERQSLAVIQVPVAIKLSSHVFTVMRAEGGGLGFLFLSREDLTAQVWKRKTDCDSVTSWELGRTIELDKLLSLNSVVERKFPSILGFAECNNAVFLWTRLGLFMVELESLQFKKVSEPHDHLICCKPFESVYAAGLMGTQDREVMRSGADNLLALAMEAARKEPANNSGAGVQLRITDGDGDASGR